MTRNHSDHGLAVAPLDPLLQLIGDGYTVEIVPLDLLGPDRAIVRVTARHGEPIDPVEVRVPSLRSIPAGIRQLRADLSGGEPDGASPAGDATDVDSATTDETRLGMMAALFGLGDPGGPAAASPAPGERRPDAAGMANAIYGTMRPASVASDRGHGVGTDDPDEPGGPSDGAGETGRP